MRVLPPTRRVTSPAHHSIGGTSYAVNQNGQLYAWGAALDGALGNNTTTNQFVPTQILVASNLFSTVADSPTSPSNSVVALELYTGHAYAWGLNNLGNLGIGSTTSQSSPVSVLGGLSYSLIANGQQHFLAVQGSTGYAWAWGDNNDGQLGINSAANQSSPVSVFGGRSYKYINACDLSSFAIEGSTGHLYGWGNNSSGQLGINTASTAETPTSVAGGLSFNTVITGGALTAALQGGTGNAYCWGNGGSGGLGNNTILSASSPVSVFGGRSFSQLTMYQNVGSIAALEGGTGRVWCWGNNNSGQAGNNTATSQSSPVSVLGGYSFSALSSGYAFVCALQEGTGNAYCWGSGTAGQLGNGLTVSQSSPVSVLGGHSFVSILACSSYVLAREYNTNALYAWGSSASGQLGSSQFGDQLVPASAVGGMSFSTISNTSSGGTTVGLVNGYAYAWGTGLNGLIGNNNTANASSPTSVFGGIQFSQIYSSTSAMNVGLQVGTGNAYCWGSNGVGELGNNTENFASTPVSVVGGYNFSFVNAGSGSVVAALQTGTGNAYCWGNNGNGQLGNNTENGASSPVSVVGGRSFTTIFTNSNATWALDGSGFAWAWGNNPVGQLGNNTTNFASSPVSVVGGLKFSQMSCGDNGTFIVAIQSTTGNAYAWGTATSGCLGNNSTATQSSPVSVFGGRSYSSFACGGSGTFVVAIEGSTGNAYAWGAGTDGQLGNNSNVNASTPVSVVGGRSFKQVSVTYFGTAGAIEASTGNAYCWGLGTTGQLGNNTFGSSVFASSPVSVFGGRSYSYILVSEGFTAAIEASTGHVYSWGSVSEGMLANGADSFACSPVLVTTVPNF